MKPTYRNIHKTLFYVALESYPSRYTLQLLQWNTDEFDRLKVDYKVVLGTSKQDGLIKTGQVLDAHGRSIWALEQMVEIVKCMSEGTINKDSVLFFEDMFHPGIEALLYIKNQTPKDTFPKVYVRCLAQTIDPDDFVNVWGMTDWMRRFEENICELVDGVLVASEELVANMRAGNLKPKEIVVTGLPFNKKEVITHYKGELPAFDIRPHRVVYSARTDAEKQPDFFLDVALHYKKKFNANVEFVIASGSQAKGNSSELNARLLHAEKQKLVKIYRGLTKDAYYHLLANSRVVFNCALQDWVSNTVSEADALGANVVYPAYRSFPETFNNDHTRLYVPWSIDDACQKIHDSLQCLSPNAGCISDHQNGTIERSLEYMMLSNKVNVHWAKDRPLPDHYRMKMKHRS